MLVGYFACLDGDLDMEFVEMLTLSKEEEYMEDYIRFAEEEDIIDPSVVKYMIVTQNYTMFNPFNNLHRFILYTALPYKFVVNGEEYTKKLFASELQEEDNAYLIEDPYIVDNIKRIGFMGYLSNDRGYTLYTVFNPHKHLVYQSKKKKNK